ncbi:ribokinase [Thermoactinomyces mirandus]|uniref:Deoxyribokinase n=1 Tax=Thermoactinomyces mirandus TaxID=2756294 RepID=A0A7W2ARV6_9BACL|nr:ribokinase [Thermoactinomyces mirandus]MBA4603394.1 ribokinase [Thermoactinomyces mirandus]
MKKILVIGSFMTDLVVQTDKVPVEGETTIGKTFNRFTGGKGANQAVAAARLGGNVTMAGKLGKDDFGKEHMEALKANGIDFHSVLFDPEASTGIGNIVIDSTGNNRIIVVPGANLKLTEQDIENMETVIRTSDIVVLQLEIPMATVYKAVDLANRHGKTVILNPAPAQKINPDIVNKVDYIIPNETEASLLANVEVKSLEDARKASEMLLNQGYKNVIITLGEKGVVCRNHEQFEHFKPYKVKAVDTTAAGDSFIGSFAFGLSKDLSIDQAIELAVAASALTVTKLGAQPSLPTMEEVEALRKGPINVKVDQL